MVKKKKKLKPTGKFQTVMVGREKFYLIKPKLLKKVFKTSAYRFEEKKRKKPKVLGYFKP